MAAPGITPATKLQAGHTSHGDALILAGGQSVWPMRRTAPCKAPLPGGSAVISIVRNCRGSTPVVIVRVADPELPTTNEPPVVTCGWSLVLPGAAHQHT